MKPPETTPEPTPDHPWTISGHIAPAPIGPLYKLGTTLTALAMVLLPLVYLGLIGGVAWAIYAQVTSEPELLTGSRHSRDDSWSFLTPIIGVIVIVFMIKPLFARRQRTTPPMEIKREQHPRLFAFIEEICTLVRAPRPRRVTVDLNVNASASFRRGWWSLAGNDLTLTIGLPLVTGLSTRELGGVFAHEFGHFAQGAGMRLTYMIRSINAWFARLVYERDRWDEFLRAAASKIDFRIGLILHLARAMVWLTRKVLWVFLHAAHGISCFMLRQMEFDADHYETQVAGSAAFQRTCRALPVIGAGWRRAVGRQQESFAAKRLVDDLATYTALETQRVSAETRTAIGKMVEEAKTGWFDTHPADADRMRAAERAQAAGVLAGDGPATELFGDFPALARQATADYYRIECEINLANVQLLPLAEVEGEAEKLAETERVTEDFFQNLLTLRTMIFLSPGELRQTPPMDQLELEARTAVQVHASAMADVKPQVEQLLAADRVGLQAAQAQALLAAGFKLNKPAEFGLKRGHRADADAAAANARTQIAEQVAGLEQRLAAVRARLVAGLRFYFLAPRLARLDAADGEEIERLTRIIGRLENVAPSLVNLRNQSAAFELLLHNNSDEVSQTFINTARSTGQEIARAVAHITGALENLEYPFGHALGSVSLVDFLVEAHTHADESIHAFLRGQALLDRLFTLYYRIMGRLALLALRAERAVLTAV